MNLHPLLLIVTTVIVLIGGFRIASSFLRCSWTLTTPIIFVVALVLLYNWLH